MKSLTEMYLGQLKLDGLTTHETYNIPDTDTEEI